MTVLHMPQFRGTVPKTDPRKLPEGFAQVAENCHLESGSLRPFNGKSVERTPNPGATLPAEVQGLFLYEGVFWLNWVEPVRALPGPIDDLVAPGDRRLYWTGSGTGAKKGDLAKITSTGANGPLPVASYDLGVPAPTTAPTLADGGEGTDPDTEDRAYVYTFVSVWGEESAPSPAATITVNIDDEVDLTDIETFPAGDHNLLGGQVFIYRTNGAGAGSIDNDFFLVTEIAIGTTTATDDVLAASLGEKIPSWVVEPDGTIVTWDVPPAGLEGLTALPGGFFAGFVNKTVYFSEPFQPHAWPSAYSRQVDYPIVGQGGIRNALMILTEGFPYVFVGDHPLSMAKDRINVPQACVSERSIVEGSNGVVYASADGLVQIRLDGVSLPLRPYMTRAEWQDLNPSTLHGVVHDGKYFGFYRRNDGSKGGFILDPAAPELGLIFLTDYATAAHADVTNDQLYLVIDNVIYLWDADEDARLRYRYRTGERSSAPHNYAAAAVQADWISGLSDEELTTHLAARQTVIDANALIYVEPIPGPVNTYGLGMTADLNGTGYQDPPTAPSGSLDFRYYGELVLRLERVVNSDEPFRLPSGFLARRHSIELEGDVPIEIIGLGDSREELA